MECNGVLVMASYDLAMFTVTNLPEAFCVVFRSSLSLEPLAIAEPSVVCHLASFSSHRQLPAKSNLTW